MKVTTKLVCAVTTCLLVTSAMAQQCERGSNRLLGLLQASPTDACREQMLAIVSVQDFVKEAAVVFRALSVICEVPECLEYVRMFAEECVPSYVSILGLACGRNEQAGLYCFQTVAQNNGTFLLAQCFPRLYIPSLPATATDPAPVVTETFPQEPSSTAEVSATSLPSVCSDSCRNAVEAFRAIHGCCVTNAFNTSAFGLQVFPIANYSLWSACGVETVSTTCPSPFVVDGPSTTAGPATGSGYVLVAHGMISLLALLMALEFIV